MYHLGGAGLRLSEIASSAISPRSRGAPGVTKNVRRRKPREIEEVANQALESFCFALDHAAGALGVDDAVREALGVAADRRQRRSSARG